MWGIPCAVFLIAFFHRAAVGTVAKDLMSAFEGGGTMIGALSATYFYPYAALMIPGGMVVDAFGVRRVVALGGSVIAAGTLLMALAESPGALFGGRFLIGLGASVTFVGCVKIAAAWFTPDRFGTLSASTATVGSLGALASTTPLALLASLAGWRGAFVVVALVTAAGALLCWWVVRDDGPYAGVAETAPSGRAVVRGTWRVLANRHTWPPFLTFFCLYGAFGNYVLWVIPFCQDVYGRSRTEATLFATATPLALLVSGPLTGYVSDRILRRRRLPYAALCGASFGLWVLFVTTLGAVPAWALYLLFLAMGLFGSAFVLTWAIGREVNPPALAGVSVAVVNLGGFLGAALTQAPIGALLDARWAGISAAGARVYPVAAYQAAFTACAVFALAATVGAVLVRETFGRNVYDADGRSR